MDGVIDLLEDDLDDEHSGDEYQLINEEDSLVGDQRDYEYQSAELNDSSIDLEGVERYDDDDLVEEDMLDDSFGDASNDGDNNMDTANLDRSDLQRLVNVFQKQISYMKNRLVTLQQELQRKNHIIENLTWRYESGDLPASTEERHADTNSIEDLRNLMVKSGMIAQKTMLENFELREEKEELKEKLKEKEAELKQRKSTEMAALNLDEKKPHRRKRSMSVGAIAWLEEDDEDELATLDDSMVGKKKTKGRARDPSLGAVADLFDPAERVEMGFDKDGHALKSQEEPGQWFWMPNKPNPQAPVRRVDPSFGGVAELFGDPNASAHPSATKAEQHSKAAASFGGVVDMFGETQAEAEEEADAYNDRVQTKSRKRDPSFGGVADMFVEEGSDEEPSTISDGGAQKTKNVGAFFQDEHTGPARTRVSKKRDPSFSGVADLFDDEGPDEDDDDLSPLNSDEEFGAKPSTGGKRKRDPSFSGVADLFGDDSEESESAGNAGVKHKKAEASIGFGISGMSFSQKFGAGAEKEDVPQTSGRSRKRDPSFGGVADMFADAELEQSSEEEHDTGASGAGHRKAEASVGFGISEMSFSQKFAKTGDDADTKKSEVILPPTIKPPPQESISPDNSHELNSLKKRLKDVEDSKRQLVQVLSLEFDRLRGIIKALSIQSTQTADGSLLSSFFSTVA